MSEQETRQLRETLLKGLDITFDKLVEQKKQTKGTWYRLTPDS